MNLLRDALIDLKLQIAILQQLERHLAALRQGGGIVADHTGRMPVGGKKA